jgi:hypothetical protein
MSRVDEILAHVNISSVWCALGGHTPNHGRAPAFWRKTRDPNVSLNDAKGTWFDFARGEGGGILDLVEHVRGCSRSEAVQWLADLAGIPLDEHPLTQPEKRDWARAKRQAVPLARMALSWWQARLSELEDLKRKAFDGGGLDVECLRVAAPELLRLENLCADAVVAEYMTLRRIDPAGTRELVRIGETWERVCKAVVMAVLRQGKAEAHRAA